MLLLPKLPESCLHSSMGHAPSALPNQKGTMRDRQGGGVGGGGGGRAVVWLSHTGKQQQAQSQEQAEEEELGY